MLVLASCLYLEPSWKPERNLPPDILFPPPTGEVHLFPLDQYTRVQVEVRENDGDSLRFSWTFPEASEATVIDFEPEPGLWVSSLTVSNKDPSLHNQSIRCDIVDAASPNPNRLQVTWRIHLEAI
jgi:hypothetical protein